MIKQFDSDRLNALSEKAKTEKRLRAHANVHETLDANVQRLFIATEPDTYMRPHRHTEAHKWEFLVVLRGRLDLITFSDSGVPLQHVELSATATIAIEIPPNTWHCYVCMQSDTLALEVKEGAYVPTGSADFASWAPEEYSQSANAYLDKLRAFCVSTG